MSEKGRRSIKKELPKAATGIEGFDDITNGGLPRGRPTLIVGGPGSGKTLFAMEFLVNGATKYDEPGVFFSFEETEDELVQNVRSLGFDLKDLESKNLLSVDHIWVEASEIVETGDYDLEGLFVRMGFAIDSIGAKRVALDTIESIFSAFGNTVVLRSELRRLFRFLKDKGVTAVITGEKGIEGTLTRNGLEEYVSDAVIMLDNRVIGNIATRRMRVLKYRGSSHGSNEYPFLIDESGFSVLPITTLGLTATASNERVSTGVPDLDGMLGGRGFFRGSSVLVTGQAGTGKSSFCAAFARAACKKGKRTLYLTFEESSGQLIRNFRSIGIDLQPYVKSGLLRIIAERPTSFGLEMHLVSIHKYVNEFKPGVVILDPISSLMTIGEDLEVWATLVRMVDFLKNNGVTSMFTDLKHSGHDEKSSFISSFADTWILLENIEVNGEANRILRLIKSRGMPHSNQIREFHLSNDGIRLTPPYVGPAGVLTGSARYAQEARDAAEVVAREEEMGRLKLQLEQQRNAAESRLEAMRAEHASKEAELERMISEENRRREAIKANSRRMEAMRSAGGEED